MSINFGKTEVIDKNKLAPVYIALSSKSLFPAQFPLMETILNKITIRMILVNIFNVR